MRLRSVSPRAGTPVPGVSCNETRHHHSTCDGAGKIKGMKGDQVSKAKWWGGVYCLKEHCLRCFGVRVLLGFGKNDFSFFTMLCRLINLKSGGLMTSVAPLLNPDWSCKVKQQVWNTNFVAFCGRVKSCNFEWTNGLVFGSSAHSPNGAGMMA